MHRIILATKASSLHFAGQVYITSQTAKLNPGEKENMRINSKKGRKRKNTQAEA